MPRLFVHPPGGVPLSNRLRLFARGPINWDFPIAKQIFDVDWAQLKAFLSELPPGVHGLHAPEFVPPTPQRACGGCQVFGAELRERLATRHKLGGEGALIIIVDGGVDAESLKPHGVQFDATSVKGPFVPTGARIHGTMCAADAFLAAPQARFADLSVSDNRDDVSAQVLAAFEGLLESAKGPTFDNYSACIVSMSLQLSAESAADDQRLPPEVRLAGNPRHVLWEKAGRLQEAGFDVVMAAGNDGCNPMAPHINGLALHPSVLTVGAVDAGGRVEPVSSRGQGSKPDFAACTNFMWSSAESFDSGTSAATALAAGLLASFRTAHPDRHRKKLLPPALLSTLKTSLQRAEPPVQHAVQDPSAHSNEYGWGIL